MLSGLLLRDPLGVRTPASSKSSNIVRPRKTHGGHADRISPEVLRNPSQRVTRTPLAANEEALSIIHTLLVLSSEILGQDSSFLK
jgi:hypothetical protein